MAQFGALQITVKGVALLQKAQLGAVLSFVRCAVGDGTLPAGTEITTITNLINEKSSLIINMLSIVNGNAMLRTTISNNGLTEGFFARELGVFANDPDEGEILYAVANAGETADFIPAYGGAEIVETIYDLIMVVGNAETVTALLDNSIAYVTRPELEAHTTKRVFDQGGVHGFHTIQPTDAADKKFIVWSKEEGKHIYSGDALTLNGKHSNEIVPPGVVMPYAGQNAPSGWLKCNGTAVSRTTYAALFAAIGTTYGTGNGTTTFNLPDLRGEFVRGADDGRGIDANRAIGSSQGEATKKHDHGYRDRYFSERAQGITGNKELKPTGHPLIGSADTDWDNDYWIYVDERTEETGGAETRPRNIAMLYIIKA